MQCSALNFSSNELDPFDCISRNKIDDCDREQIRNVIDDCKEDILEWRKYVSEQFVRQAACPWEDAKQNGNSEIQNDYDHNPPEQVVQKERRLKFTVGVQ
jgi:hypothetical protein